ncbi:hypothetical protein HYFRA_00008210 [Hymenoscyphus fraxineus]|uniref:Swi5-domain-containing protein n=1 Tax=Hymenoscyphus fraxineus TaxID=746836 RepID=A0A9N9L5K1_9HELO|nr:hypothetical protein HYFRA_00008210 [Hymenoscyphus fraxineus]
MQPPNASLEGADQVGSGGSLPETQAWEPFLGGSLELGFFPERVESSGSMKSPVPRIEVGSGVESGEKSEEGVGVGERVVETTTPKQFSYFSGTTVEFTPGVYRELFSKGVTGDGGGEEKARGEEGGWGERKGLMEGFDSSSPPPFSTLPGLSMHPIKQFTQPTQGTQPGTQFPTQPEAGRETSVEGESQYQDQDQKQEGYGELSPSLQPGSGIRRGWEGSSRRIEIPDSDGVEIDEEQAEPGTPMGDGNEGEEKVLDTPFVKLVAASVDERNGFENDQEEGVVESTLLTADLKETENEIMGERQKLVGSAIADMGDQAPKETSQILLESRERFISTFSDLGDQELETTPQHLEATHTTDSREDASETLRATQEPIISTFSDLSGQVPEVVPQTLEGVQTADSSKDGLSVIVCDTFILSPDQQHDNDLGISTSEAEFESTQVDEVPASKVEHMYTPIAENVTTQEELHNQGIVVTTLESPREDHFAIDPSITMQLPITMSLSDEDFHSKGSSNETENYTRIMNTEAEKAGSENHSSADTDPQNFDAISKHPEVESRKLSSGTTDMEPSSGEISLPGTMLPPQGPLSSTDKEATAGEDEGDTGGKIEVQVHETQSTPPAATPLSRESVGLQNPPARLEDMKVEASTTEQQILKPSISLPDATLQPNEIAVLEGLGMDGGVELSEEIDNLEGTTNAWGDESKGLSQEENLVNGEAEAERSDDLPVLVQGVGMDENEPTLPTRISQSENILGDTRSRLADNVSHTTRRTEIPDSDISLEDEDEVSIVEDQNLAVRGAGDGVAGKVEMNDADKVMKESIDVATILDELENDGHNDQAINSSAVAIVDVPSFADVPAVELNAEGSTKPPLPKTTNKTLLPDSKRANDLVENTESTGKIFDVISPVPILPDEATGVQLPTESHAEPDEESIKPASLIQLESVDTKHDEREVKSENATLPPISLEAEEKKTPLPTNKIFEPGTTKLQVQDSESVKARPNQGQRENPTTCKVVVIPASSESQFNDSPSSSSSSSNSIQQPSTVADIPPLAPPSPKATGSKKRSSLEVEEVPSPSRADILSSPPLKKQRVKNASPVKNQEDEDKSPVKDKDEVLMDELRAMKIASIQSRNTNLELEIQRVRERLDSVKKELKNPAAETVKQHIHLLHQYNDIRDVGQGLIGMIAENRGTRIGELYDEFGVGLKD